jgi:hypothetical protein
MAYNTSSGGGGNSASFSVQLSANQAAVTGNNTQYKIPYNLILFDTASGWTASPNYFYTFPFTGNYQLSVRTFLYTSSGVNTSTQFFQWASYNGAAYPGDRFSDLDPGNLGLTVNGEFLFTQSWVHAATAGDTVSVLIDCLGGTLNVGAGGGAAGSPACIFSGYLI